MSVQNPVPKAEKPPSDRGEVWGQFAATLFATPAFADILIRNDGSVPQILCVVLVAVMSAAGLLLSWHVGRASWTIDCPLQVLPPRGTLIGLLLVLFWWAVGEVGHALPRDAARILTWVVGVTYLGSCAILVWGGWRRRNTQSAAAPSADAETQSESSGRNALAESNREDVR